MARSVSSNKPKFSFTHPTVAPKELPKSTGTAEAGKAQGLAAINHFFLRLIVATSIPCRDKLYPSFSPKF
jgi:hypothetical protein